MGEGNSSNFLPKVEETEGGCVEFTKYISFPSLLSLAQWLQMRSDAWKSRPSDQLLRKPTSFAGIPKRGRGRPPHRFSFS